MIKPLLSIIIPTYNRADKLDTCLSRLHQQDISKELYEIWVVDDGSQDETQKVLTKWLAKSSILHTLKQENAGQGAARNLALEKVQGQLVLFLGDDIFAAPNFLEEHLEFHKQHPNIKQACLGLTLWEPPTNDFMEWLTNGGPQFAYHKLTPKKPVSFFYFYTSNISLKKALIHDFRFDLDFKGYGWEDTELGYRLTKESQMQIIYWPAAVATHDHKMEASSLPGKMEQIGRNAKIFQEKYPELRILPRGIKKILLTIGSAKPMLAILRSLAQFAPKQFQTKYWYWLSKHHYLKGIQ